MQPHPQGYPIKLVRDRTPEIINASGEPGQLFYAPLDGDKLPWLKKKLGEEVMEYFTDGGVNELADVAVALNELALQHGHSMDSLLSLGHGGRGGFASGFMMYGRHPEYDQ
jgi:predicted house-cleaning noncanonical NTP pyrophosphatase (MazG superfamily)